MSNAIRFQNITADWWRHHRSGTLDFLLSLCARGAGAPLALIASFLLARLLGPAGFGHYMTLLYAGLVAGGIATYGVNPVLTREIAAQPPALRSAAVVDLTRWALWLTGLLSLGSIALLWLWLCFGPNAPDSNWSERIATALLVPLWVLVSVWIGVLGGLSRVGKSQALDNLLKNGLLLGGALIFFFVGIHSPTKALWLQVIGYAAAALLGVYWVVEATNKVAHDAEKGAHADNPLSLKRRHGIWLRSASGFFGMTLATWLFVRLDVVVVNALAGGTSAGIFGAAARLAQVAQIVGLVWLRWLQPRIASQARYGKTDQLTRSLRIGLIGSAGMTSVVVFTCWLWAPDLIHLFGRGFDNAIMPFRFLLLGNLAWSIAVPYLVVITMAGREFIAAIIIWGQLGLALILSAVLIPTLGALGAAWAWTAALVAANLCIVGLGLREKNRLSSSARRAQ